MEVDERRGSGGYIDRIRPGEIREDSEITIAHMLPNKPSTVIITLEGPGNCVSIVPYIGKHVFRFYLASPDSTLDIEMPNSISFQAFP